MSNPSIIKSADNSISSPKALMLKYNPKPDKTAQTIEFERYDVLTSATGIPDSYKASYIS